MSPINKELLTTVFSNPLFSLRISEFLLLNASNSPFGNLCASSIFPFYELNEKLLNSAISPKVFDHSAVNSPIGLPSTYSSKD